jgi:hypothetical protein
MPVMPWSGRGGSVEVGGALFEDDLRRIFPGY